MLAMSNRLEDLALAMYERGIPGDINAPIFVKASKYSSSDRMSRINSHYGGDHSNNNGYGNPTFSGLQFPSYFLLAISLGLHDLVKTMLKVFRVIYLILI